MNPFARSLALLGRFFNRPRLVDLIFLVLIWLIGLAVAIGFLLVLTREANAAALSRGDRVALVVADGEDFAGQYQVSQNGELEVPHLGNVAVLGLEPRQAAARIAAALESARLFKPGRAQVTMQVMDWATIEVFVDGEVHLPGRVRLNQAPGRDRAPDPKTDLPGAATPERRLSDALRAAGGIRPTADLGHVTLWRRGEISGHDLRGLLTGAPALDPQLIDGDRIVVHNTGVTDPLLVRPSLITPPGMRIYVSNLTSPAFNNNASTMNNGSVSLPYGSRLSQAIIAANCVGGIGATNAGRHAMLVRTERLSGETRRWDAPVEALIEGSRETENPLLAEGDGVACYDSGVTTVRDVVRTLAEIILPWRVLW